MERFFDIFFSGLALLVLSPLMTLVIIILKFSGEGEIFFLQERGGKGGELFKLIKFVTMIKDSPNIGTGTVTMKDDPRILPFGKFLRKTKVNELPQLLNVILGDMSLIGPRPLAEKTFGSYKAQTQKIIKKVRPGLSGVGSIIFREEEELLYGTSASFDFYENIIAPYKGSLEEWYVCNKGMYIYFVAIFVTAWAVIFPNTIIAWKVFRELPEPPSELKQSLNFVLTK